MAELTTVGMTVVVVRMGPFTEFGTVGKINDRTTCGKSCRTSACSGFAVVGFVGVNS